MTSQPSPPKRILIAGPPPSAGGGMAAVTATITRRLTGSLDYQVEVIDSGGGRGAAGYTAFPRALATIARADADLLHLNVASGGSTLRKMALAEAALRQGLPYVIHLHGGGYAEFLGRIGPRRRRAVERFFGNASGVLVLGEEWRDVLVGALGLSRGEITLVPNGVDAVPRCAESSPRIVAVGSVTEAKGIDVLLDALGPLLAKHPDWHVDLVGPTPDPHLVERAQSVSVESSGRVHLRGSLDSAARDAVYAGASVFVLPSRTEALPLVLLEAMSGGLACVATRVGSVPSVLDHDRTGRLVPPGDPQALAAALTATVEDDALRRRLGANARADWERRFSADLMMERIAAAWAVAAPGLGPTTPTTSVTTAPTTAPTTTVSVIIPTLGRDSLTPALASVMRQGVPVEVVIVNDSGAPLRSDLDLDLDDPDTLRIVDTSGRIGAAAARNLGMTRATGDLIAFLDDDDEWLPGHLADAIALLARRPEVDIYASRGLVIQPEGRQRVEPVELLGHRTVSSYFFGPTNWVSRCRRIMTPTLVFRRHLADLPMDTTLDSGEDTWWLLEAGARRGATVHQSAHVGVCVHAAPERAGDRSARRNEPEWVERLDRGDPGAGAGYLAGVLGREACRAGRPGAVLRLVPAVVARPKGVRWTPILALQTGVASALAARRAVRSVQGRRSMRGD